MRLFVSNFLALFLLAACSNINFLLDNNEGFDLLKNKTFFYVEGWDKPVLNDVLFLRIGKTEEKKFLLLAKVSEKETKRFVNENQVAQKIDYKITVDYSLKDASNKCAEIKNRQTSSFSFTPKSSGYNFASDILLQNLYQEAVLVNVDNFLSFANDKIRSYGCLDEG